LSCVWKNTFFLATKWRRDHDLILWRPCNLTNTFFFIFD
jgi:hypothetical protein